MANETTTETDKPRGKRGNRRNGEGETPKTRRKRSVLSAAEKHLCIQGLAAFETIQQDKILDHARRVLAEPSKDGTPKMFEGDWPALEAFCERTGATAMLAPYWEMRSQIATLVAKLSGE